MKETLNVHNRNIRTPLRVVFVIAHPDDEHIPFGLPAELVEKGHSVSLIALTKGDLGSHTIASRRKIARVRKKEFQDSGRILGAEYIKILGFHDGELLYQDKKAGKKLLRELRILQPDAVIIPNRNDYHLDHVKAYEISQWALYNVPSAPIKTRRGWLGKRIPPFTESFSVYEMDTQGSQTWKSVTEDTGLGLEGLHSVNMILSIGQTAIQKSIEAFNAHKSQLHPRPDGHIGYVELARRGAIRRGIQAGFAYGVGLSHLSFGGYAFSTDNILAKNLPILFDKDHALP